MSINNNEDSSLRQRLNLTAPTGEQLYLTQLSTGAVLNAEGSDNSIDIIGEETNYNNPAIRLMSGTTPILNIFSEKVECNKRIYMNNKPIYLKTLNTNHSITYSSYNMDGVQISGFGDSTTPFFRLRSSNGDNYVMEAFTGKLNIYKHLFLENNLNVSGATRLGNNIRVDNLYSHLPYLDLYTGDTTGPNDSLHNYHSKIRFFRTSIERAAVAYYAGGDSILIYNKEGDIGLSAHSTGAEGGRIDLKSNGTIEFKPAANNIALNISASEVNIYETLAMNEKSLDFYDGSDKYFIKTDRTPGVYSLDIRGWDAVSIGTTNGGSKEVMKVGKTYINLNEDVWLNTNALCFHNNDDDKHQIKHSWGTTDAPMNGLLIRGYGNTVPFCRFQGTSAVTDVMDLYLDKIKMYKPLYMNSTTAAGENRPIYLHTDENFYIKYSNDSSAGSPNVTEIKGYEGVHLGSNANTSMNLKVEQDRVEITKMKVIDFINLDNKEIRLRAADDPWQILGYKNASETISGSSINIDGWFIRGWNGGRISSVKGILPPFESNSTEHAVWYMSGSDARFGGPFGYNNYSDDRIKFEETTITNALQTINKLNPVLYKKGKYIGDTDYSSMKLESGFVAQEVYNNVPEMRHLVDFDKSLPRNFVDGDLSGDCVEDIYSKKTNSDGITEEKPEVCTVCYDEVIPFTVKAIQELNALVNTLQSTVNNLNQQIETQNTIISELQSKIP